MGPIQGLETGSNIMLRRAVHVSLSTKQQACRLLEPENNLHIAIIEARGMTQIILWAAPSAAAAGPPHQWQA